VSKEVAKQPGSDEEYRSIVMTRRAFASVLNNVIKLGFCGLTLAAVMLACRVGPYYFFDYFVVILCASVVLIIVPMIPLSLFCLPQCAKCGEKFNYPKYTADPEECQNCHLTFEKKKPAIRHKKSIAKK
jgi:hypothetical protein